MTAGELALSWSWEPLTIFTIGLVAVFYTRGLRHIRPAKVRVIVWWRPVLFYTGLAVILLALISPLDTLGARLFLFHMTQHMLLGFVGAPLVLLGAPVLPLVRGLPYGLRRTTVIALSHSGAIRGLAHLLTRPIVAWSLFAATFWLWHIPALYSAAVTNDLVHIVQHTSFLLTALLFWWGVIDPVPMAGRMPYSGRFAYVILALVQGLPLAALLTFTPTPWYAPYIGGEGLWGIDPLADQQLGGIIMWIGGMVPYFIALAALLGIALSAEEESVRRAEALAAERAGA